MRPKVILVEKPRKLNTDKTEPFGDTHYIFPPGAARSSIWNDDFETEALHALYDMGYDPKTDYIVLAGPTVTLIKVIARMISVYNVIRVLCWSATEQDYLLQEIGDNET